MTFGQLVRSLHKFAIRRKIFVEIDLNTEKKGATLSFKVLIVCKCCKG